MLLVVAANLRGTYAARSPDALTLDGDFGLSAIAEAANADRGDYALVQNVAIQASQ